MADEGGSTMRDNDGESEPGVLRRLTDEIGLTTPEAHSEAQPAPKGSRRSDERIREDICEALISEVRVDVSEVTVEVRDGHVTLDGAVPMRRMRYIIEDVAAACRGVNDVDNRIRVAS
jgi:osmotically-inducible protein OsmY